MFDQAKATQICDELAFNPVSLQSILRQPGMPSSAEVYRWLAENAPFRENLARARDIQADTDADEVANVRARVLVGDITPEQGRVAIQSLQWSAGVRAPKRYGARIQSDIDMQVTVNVVNPFQIASDATVLAAVDALPALDKPDND